MTKITSLNCNGLRSAARKGLWKWVKQHRPDVLCLQEIRIQHHQLHEADAFPKDYFAYYNPAARPGYAGTAVLTRHKPDRVIFGGGWDRADSEGRWTEVIFDKTAIISLYVPSGSGLGDKQDKKEVFMDHLWNRLAALKATYERVVVCADWNMCHRECDLKNWKANRKNSGFLDSERDWLDRLFNQEGWNDVFRSVEQPEHTYSWWSNRGNAFANNVGWRLDYHLYHGTSSAILATEIDRDAQLSDHAPVTHQYNWSL